MRSIREVCLKDHGAEEIRGWGYRELGNRWVDAIQKGYVWVVEQAGAIRGVGYLKIDGARAILHALYLTPEVLGQGLGLRLINLIVEKAKERGAATLVLDSTITAREFYLRCGFTETGPKKREEVGGSLVTCFPMERRI